MRGADFNALFAPMRDRGGIVQFAKDSAELDAQDTALIDRIYGSRRGASYFLVVARASPDGPPKHNQQLSRARAEAVMQHLSTRFADPELERQVGLLWLGEEFAQLEQAFCTWPRSGDGAGQGKGRVGTGCSARELNRSAFAAWIDCRL